MFDVILQIVFCFESFVASFTCVHPDIRMDILHMNFQNIVRLETFLAFVSLTVLYSQMKYIDMVIQVNFQFEFFITSVTIEFSDIVMNAYLMVFQCCAGGK